MGKYCACLYQNTGVCFKVDLRVVVVNHFGLREYVNKKLAGETRELDGDSDYAGRKMETTNIGNYKKHQNGIP